MESTVQKIEKIVTPEAEKLGLSLVDVEYMQDGGYWYVRIYVEKLDGDVNLEDCANLSGNIEDAVDQLIDKKFFLEVSSPGFVALKHKIHEKRNVEGILLAYENQTLLLEVEGEELQIPFSEVKKSHLVFDFDEF